MCNMTHSVKRSTVTCDCVRAIMLCNIYVREIIPMTVCMCVLRHVIIFEETFCIYEAFIFFMWLEYDKADITFSQYF